MRRITLLAVLLVGGATATPAGATPSDALWQAVTHVESRGEAEAYNAREGAAGVAQIRPVALRDVNRIARLRGLDTRFSSRDRFDPEKSREMWELYLKYYGEHYRKQTGRNPTDEVYARIWNGGPNGWAKDTTRPYWKRVRAAIE